MEILYDVLGWLLGAFYKVVPNYFVALALFALFFKLILLPSAISQQKGTAKQARLQPKLRRIQERYKGDKNAQQKIQEEQQALYQREGFNPMNMGCLPLLIQFPIIIGLYGVIYKPLTYALRIPGDIMSKLTKVAQDLKLIAEAKGSGRSTVEISIIDSIVENTKGFYDAALDAGVSSGVLEQIKEFGMEEFTLFGKFSLSQNPSFGLNLLVLIPILSCLTSLLTSLVSFLRSKRNNPGAANNATMGCMTFGMPLFSLYFVTQFPAAIGIYWIINNIYSFIQTLVVGHFYSSERVIAKQMVEETIARRSKEANTKLVAAKKNENN